MTHSDLAQTLEQRLAEGRIFSGEALRLAALLAERLRQMHDEGKVHGGLTPAAIAIEGDGLTLRPASARGVTPYTAPEVCAGRPADPRSDIFAFGAIVYEMLTGRRAFAGVTAEALIAALTHAAPHPSGSTAVDRLVAACVAKSPDSRFQRVQKVQLELRLLISAARRGKPGSTAAAKPAEPAAAKLVEPVGMAAPRPAAVDSSLEPAPQAFAEASVQSQMQEFESRIARRFEEQERSVASVARIANEVLNALRVQQAVAPVPSPAPPAPAPRYRGLFDPLDGDSGSRLEGALQVVTERVARMDLTVSNLGDRLQKLEQNLDAFDTDAAALRDSVTRDIRNFERSLKQQSVAIESARTAMGQTDDLVERVVEALDSLQSMFITDTGERAAAVS